MRYSPRLNVNMMVSTANFLFLFGVSFQLNHVKLSGVYRPCSLHLFPTKRGEDAQKKKTCQTTSASSFEKYLSIFSVRFFDGLFGYHSVTRTSADDLRSAGSVVLNATAPGEDSTQTADAREFRVCSVTPSPGRVGSQTCSTYLALLSTQLFSSKVHSKYMVLLRFLGFPMISSPFAST